MRSAAGCPSMVRPNGVGSHRAIGGKTALRPHYGSPYGEPLQGGCIATVTAREVSLYGVGSCAKLSSASMDVVQAGSPSVTSRVVHS